MGVTGDFCGVNLGARFRRIDSRGAKPAEPGRRWEANYKLKLGQRLASRLPSGGAGGRELRRRENKARLAVFGSMMAGACIPSRTTTYRYSILLFGNFFTRLQIV